MASVEKHQMQYESNKEFIDNVLSSDTSKNDWVVTAAFYSALHLVDKTIVSSIGEEFKPTSHIKRNLNVGKLSNFRQIRRFYTALYMESRKSRYDCVNISDSVRDSSLVYLNEIEKSLNK